MRKVQSSLNVFWRISRIAICSLLLSGGLAKAQIAFPINKSQGPDPIAGIGYMQTNVTITSAGQLSATTHTWSAKELEGFHGSVAVAALDKNQALLWVSATQTYGVDQKACPPFVICKSDRTDNWSDTIPTQVLSQTAYIAIKHRYTPKGVTFDDIGNWLRGLGNDVARELGPILQALGLVSTPPPQQTPLACGPGTGPSPNHPFTVVTLGDSIMWGQGLPDGQKFRDRVTAWLQGQFGASRQVIQIATRAHSGAILAVGPTVTDTETGLTGEIPDSYPTISKQLELTLTELQQTYHITPANVDLLLIDGGINNVDVLEILKPNHSTGTIENFTNAAMDKMQALLQDAMRCFPSAAIVVTGYYPIVSSATDLGALTALFGEFGAELGSAGGVVGAVVGVAGGAGVAALSKDQMVRNSAAFADTAHTRLMEMANQSSGRVALAWPNFQTDNSYGAPNSWLWTVTDFVGPEADGVAGTDPPPAGTPNRVAWDRARDCVNVGQAANPKCLDASMGHPNIAGAQAYTDAIITKLQAVFAAKLGLPQPKTLFTRLNSGTDANGPYVSIANDPYQTQYWTQVPTWIQVNAVNSSNNPVQANVVAEPIPPRYWDGTQTFEGLAFGVVPAGYETGFAQTGQKIYYMCLPGRDPISLPNGYPIGTIISASTGRPSNQKPFPGNQQGCSLQVTAPGYVTCYLQLGQVPQSSGGILGAAFGTSGVTGPGQSQPCPAAPTIGGNIATVQNNTTAGGLHAGMTGQLQQVQLPALAATVSSNAPSTSPITDTVTVTTKVTVPDKGGQHEINIPVAGATVTLNKSTFVTSANGIAVITHSPCLAGSQVAKVGETTAPKRTPVPCNWIATASKAGYQSFSLTLP